MTKATMLHASLRLGIGSDVAIGPGKAQLLQLIRETGSIASAARRMGMSYKRAWSLVATLNQCFSEPLVTVSRGGSDHGGAAVSELGEVVLEAYLRLTRLVDASDELAEIRRLVAGSAIPAESPGTA